jgi:cytochrome c556
MPSAFPCSVRIAAVVLAASLLGGLAVQAAPSTMATIKARQDKLRDMGSALKAIDDELKKRTVDWDNVILPNAQTVKDRSGYLLTWFSKGTGPESGVKTYALLGVWQKADEFTRLGKAAQAEAAKLSQVAAGKDAAAVKAQAFAMGKACKACHDDYRSKDYEKDNDE